MRDAVTTGGNALPRDDEPDVTRFKSAAAKRVQAHRARGSLWGAVPDGSKSATVGAPSDQHRLPFPGALGNAGGRDRS